MWTVGIRTLSRLYVPWALRGSGGWAGHRLIIPGDYSDGYPDGVFTDSDLAIIDNTDYNEDDDEGFFGPLLRLAYDITVDRNGYNAESKLHLRLAEGRRYRGTPPWMQKFLAWTCSAEPSSLEYPTNPVLRNLTKKEYVRADALTLPHGYRVWYGSNPVTLGHAVMSRIVWSADPTVSIALSDEFADKFIHGVWAGCAFDIVELGEWAERDGWNDVSAEVKEDLIYMGLQEGALSYDPSEQAESNSDEGDGSQ